MYFTVAPHRHTDVKVPFLFLLQSVFSLLLGPFVFFNAQKTKYLQILTSLMRWIGKNQPSLHHKLLMFMSKSHMTSCQLLF